MGEFQYNLSGDRLSNCNPEAGSLLNDKLNYIKVKKKKKKNLHGKKKIMINKVKLKK